MSEKIFAEMDYGKSFDGTRVLAKGEYRGFQFAVLNIRGDHPCGYVNVGARRGDLEDDGEFQLERFDWVKCHGGVTYAHTYLDGCDDGFWIGWDYAHFGDYAPPPWGFRESGTRYTTADVVEECKRVIDQICGRLKTMEDAKMRREPETADEVIAAARALADSEHRAWLTDPREMVSHENVAEVLTMLADRFAVAVANARVARKEVTK